ncbi:hypothetical protein D1007_06933 [Hordeum vulgare]|nr:hypothetical protein D1007_06933 [Hordeum vulgare]
MRRASYFARTVAGPRRAREVRRHTRVRGITPTPSPSPPSPPRMMEEEEASLIQRVMEDSMATHDERQWSGLDRAMALSAAGDVAMPEPKEEEEVAAFPTDIVGASWGWSCTAPEMAQAVGAVNWCPTPLRSPEREASSREEVLQASFHHAPCTRDRRPTFGRCRPTLTPSATATTRTPATSEDGGGDGDDERATFFNVNYVENWAILWP